MFKNQLDENVRKKRKQRIKWNKRKQPFIYVYRKRVIIWMNEYGTYSKLAANGPSDLCACDTHKKNKNELFYGIFTCTLFNGHCIAVAL